jgi:hypothetical protein
LPPLKICFSAFKSYFEIVFNGLKRSERYIEKPPEKVEMKGAHRNNQKFRVDRHIINSATKGRPVRVANLDQ